MALSTSIGLPPDTDSTLHWVYIISLTIESETRRYSLDCCFAVHLKVKPPLLRTKLKKWSPLNNFAVLAMSAESKTVITFHRKILLNEILSPRLLFHIARVQFSSSRKHFAALSSAFSNQVVGEVSVHQETATSPSLYKKCFLQGKNYTNETKENFQTLACNAYQNCPSFRLQNLVGNRKL